MTFFFFTDISIQITGGDVLVAEIKHRAHWLEGLHELKILKTYTVYIYIYIRKARELVIPIGCQADLSDLSRPIRLVAVT